jgi:putative membrane protein
MMMLFGLLVPILLIALFAYLLGWRPGNVQLPGNMPNRPEPLDVLKQRYARGEISREEYEQIRRDLA